MYYTIQLTPANELEWTSILEIFDDANIYQTIEYSKLSKGGKNLYQVIIRKHSTIIAASLVRIVKLPFLSRGIAYIFWGPLIRSKDNLQYSKSLNITLQLLYNELVIKRNFVVRIVPQGINENHKYLDDIFENNQFVRSKKDRIRNTIVLDISHPLEELRKNFLQKWRNLLNKAERSNLEIVQGTDDNLFQQFLDIYSELIGRKKFSEGVNVNTFRKIQLSLSDKFKMRIFICMYEGKPIAGLVGTAIGDTGIYLLGATNNIGMKLPGAYLLQWEMISWLKNQSCKYYDLGGIDPDGSPGVYKFKLGLNGTEYNYIGEFESKKNNLSKLLIHLIERLRK
jgi:lipid II:glycine glycyltransferase (peptidoglycan interpeptide bridge formation enzyme)